eukprot:14315742-Alexandrium_andersonii.AAC.1
MDSAPAVPEGKALRGGRPAETSRLPGIDVTLTPRAQKASATNKLVAELAPAHAGSHLRGHHLRLLPEHVGTIPVHS